MAYATIVVAGAIGSWYWAGGRQDGDRTQISGEVGTAMYNATRYHLGTIAFGSLIIAIIRFLRAILAVSRSLTEPSSMSLYKVFVFRPSFDC
jgi:hypothetical protein